MASTDASNGGGNMAMTMENALLFVAALLQQNDARQALFVARQIASQAPTDSRAALTAADAAAAADAADASSLRERAALLCFSAGRQRLHVGDGKGAANAFYAAIAVKPDAPYGYHFLGEALMAQNRAADATRAYTRALRHNPTDYASAQRLTDAFSALNCWRQADAASRVVQALFPAVASLLFVNAATHFAYERHAAAEKALLRAVAVEGGWKPAYYREYGKILQFQGRIEEAAAAFEKAVAADPQRRDAMFSLALCAAWSGRPGVIPAAMTNAADRYAAQAKERAAAGDFLSACEAATAAATLKPTDATTVAAAEQAYADALQALSIDPRDIAERNPEWVKAQCLIAESRYVATLAANPQWSGVPGLTPTPAAPRRPQIWDCFMFYNELDMLELRLNELADTVDRFVLSESPWTHQGGPKPMWFQENRARFAAFADRIVHVVADQRLGKLPWDQEYYQRECLINGLDAAKADDLALICDVDEIPRVETIRQLAADPSAQTRMTALSITNFNYFLNFAALQPCIRPVMLPVAMARRLGVNQARYVTCRAGPQITPTAPDAGWHFSWFGGVDMVWRKLQSFCHVELLGPVQTKEQLQEKLETGDFAILKGVADGRFILVDDSFPHHVRANMDRMREFGWLFQPKN